MKVIGKPFLSIFITIVAGIILDNCASYNKTIKIGIRCYEKGDYGAALAQFERIEEEVSELSLKTKALYFLYKGLTHLAIGEREVAKQFILEAELLRQKEPKIIRGKHLVRLENALATLFGNETY